MAGPWTSKIPVRRRVLTDLGFRDLLHPPAAAPDPAWPPPDESIFDDPDGVRHALREWTERSLSAEGRIFGARIAALMVLPPLVHFVGDDSLVHRIERDRRIYHPEPPPNDERNLSARVIRAAIMALAQAPLERRPVSEHGEGFGPRTVAELEPAIMSIVAAYDGTPLGAELWAAAFAARSLRWAEDARYWDDDTRPRGNAGPVANALVAALQSRLALRFQQFRHSALRLLDEVRERRMQQPRPGQQHDPLTTEVRRAVLDFLADWWARVRARLSLDRPWFSPRSLWRLLEQLNPHQQAMAAAIAARMVRNFPTPKVHRQQVAAPTPKDREEIEERLDRYLAGERVSSNEGWYAMVEQLDDQTRPAWSTRTAHPRDLSQLTALAAASMADYHEGHRVVPIPVIVPVIVAIQIAAYAATGIPVATVPWISVRDREVLPTDAHEYNETEMDVAAPFPPAKLDFLDQWWSQVRKQMPELAHLTRLM